MLSSLPLQTTAPLQPAVLYMRGVTGPALLKLLDFMYNGEANVEHGLLKEFLQVGEDLRYRTGLTTYTSSSVNELFLIYRVEGLCEKGSQQGEGEVEDVSIKKEPFAVPPQDPVLNPEGVVAPKPRGRSLSKPDIKREKTGK